MLPYTVEGSEQLIRTINFLQLPGQWQPTENRMVIGMITQRMPFGDNALHQLRMLLGLTTNHEKAGAGIMRTQKVEQGGGMDGIGAIIESQINRLVPS